MNFHTVVWTELFAIEAFLENELSNSIIWSQANDTIVHQFVFIKERIKIVWDFNWCKDLLLFRLKSRFSFWFRNRLWFVLESRLLWLCFHFKYWHLKEWEFNNEFFSFILAWSNLRDFKSRDTCRNLRDV